MGKNSKQKRIPPNYLDGVPVRSARHPWREREDGMAEVDMEHTGFYARIAQVVFKKPRVSHIALDRYGSVVWRAMDGEHTVADIIHIMETRFPDEKQRMMDRVVTFLAILQKNGFITMKNIT